MSHHNTSQVSAQESQLDEQFIVYMLEIDSRYKSMMKQDRVRVEQWSKVLCQANSSFVWKKNRNLYSMQLLDCVLNNTLKKPFSLPPPARAVPKGNPGSVNDSNSHGLMNQCSVDDQGSSAAAVMNNDFVLPVLSKTQVMSSISIRFKHLNLEVDKQKIVNQLTSSNGQDTMRDMDAHYQPFEEDGEEDSHSQSNIYGNEEEEVNLSSSNNEYGLRQQNEHEHYYKMAKQKHNEGPSNNLMNSQGDQDDPDENPRPQRPNSVVRHNKEGKNNSNKLKRKGARHHQQSTSSSQHHQKRQQMEEELENTQQNFQEQHTQMMLRAAEEQLKQFDLPRQMPDGAQSGEVKRYKNEIFQLQEENRAYACQVAQLQTQLEVQQIAEKHQKEQMYVKDQMLGMQEEMLTQLNQEVEKLKLMLLAKKQVENKPPKQQQEQQLPQEMEFQSSSTSRMAGTAKAMIPPSIQKQNNLIAKRSGGADSLTVNRSKGKQLIIPDEIREAKRRQKQIIKEQKRERGQDEGETNSPLIKSHVSLSDCGERDLYLMQQSTQSPLKSSQYSQQQQDQELQYSQNLQESQTLEREQAQKIANTNVVPTISNDGATLQLQNYINSVDERDLNFLQDSSMLLSQRLANQEMAPQDFNLLSSGNESNIGQPRQEQQYQQQQQQPQSQYVFSESQNESDRFLEEVILSRKPQYEKQIKNEFLPKSNNNQLQTIREGEMSIQDLSHDISIVNQRHDRTVSNATGLNQHNQTCNKTVDCSCGCEDDESFSMVNRTQQDHLAMKRLKQQREFYAQINTEIQSCTQNNSDLDLLAESRATSNGSPARLLDQLLASQGASAFQPQFNYRKHLQQNQDEIQALEESKLQSSSIPQSIHGGQNNGNTDINQHHNQQRQDDANQKNLDMPMAAQSLATESQFERFYTDLIT